MGGKRRRRDDDGEAMAEQEGEKEKRSILLPLSPVQQTLNRMHLLLLPTPLPHLPLKKNLWENHLSKHMLQCCEQKDPLAIRLSTPILSTRLWWGLQSRSQFDRQCKRNPTWTLVGMPVSLRMKKSSYRCMLVIFLRRLQSSILKRPFRLLEELNPMELLYGVARRLEFSLALLSMKA